MVKSSPAVADGIVFFGSWDNYLYAVDVKTGQEKWKFKTDGEVFTSPAVADGIVFFGSKDNYLYALE
jgi:outer membrane protein assembly factor BamB